MQSMMACRADWVTQKLEEVTLYPVAERLMYLLEREEELHNCFNAFQLQGLTQTELAEQIGTSRVNLSRVLKHLKKNKRIVQKGRHLSPNSNFQSK